MENTTIGKATLVFTEVGAIAEAKFEPTAMSVPFMGPDFRVVGTCENVDHIQKRADLVFATWFSRMNEIELADREKYTIKSNLIKATNFESGRPKECEIEYSFEKLEK